MAGPDETRAGAGSDQGAGLTRSRAGSTIVSMTDAPTPDAAPIEEISFLADVAHLAATARTWEDLMGTSSTARGWPRAPTSAPYTSPTATAVA